MSWPKAMTGHQGRRMDASLLPLAVACGLVLAMCEPALAEMEPDETLIGTFEIDPSAPEAGALAGDADELPLEGAAAEANQRDLFGEALALLDRDRLAAQRILERVIALDPDTTLAAEARYRLGELYRNLTPPSAAPPRSTVERALLAGPENLGRPEGAADRPAAPARPKERRAAGDEPASELFIPVPEALERQFILEAGDRIFFSTGSADLGGRARAVLEAQAQWLSSHPAVEARIEGHADDLPLRPEQQEELSEMRAEAVRQRLVAEGVDPQRLGIVPWGRERRIAECDEPACAVQNRRAVTVLVVRGGPSDRGSLGGAPHQSPLARATMESKR